MNSRRIDHDAAAISAAKKNHHAATSVHWHAWRVLRFVEDPAASLDRFDAQHACGVHDTVRMAGPQFIERILYGIVVVSGSESARPLLSSA